MRVALLTRDSPEQRYLAERLAAAVELVAVVHSQNVPRRPPKLRYRLLLNRLAFRTVGRSLLRAWFDALASFENRAANWPVTPLVATNINDPEVIAHLERTQPELVAVSARTW